MLYGKKPSFINHLLIDTYLCKSVSIFSCGNYIISIGLTCFPEDMRCPTNVWPIELSVVVHLTYIIEKFFQFLHTKSDV